MTKTKIKKDRRPPNTAKIDNNIILSSDVAMSLDDYFTQRNLNVFVVGGPGTRKTRGYIIPNLLNANTSFCITDPKSEVLRSCGKLLQRLGYDVKVFNLDEMKYSSNYNPFNYVFDCDGKLDYNAVLKMVGVLMKNVAGGGKNERRAGQDPFWETSAEKLITAIALLLLEEGSKTQQNFATVAEKMRLIEFPEDPKDKNFQSTLDKEFSALERKNPESLGVLMYREFKQGASKTMKSVISVANSKLQKFNLPKVKNLTHCDNLNLEQIGDRKTALFIITPVSDTSFNFLASIMYTQLFDILYRRANFKYGGRLPIHVRFLLDEFANLGELPGFEQLITTMRGMNISANIILQAVSQLEKLYEESWRTIIAGCDSFIFLGGQEELTLKYVSERLGKETIDIVNRGQTKSWRQNSSNINNAIHGRELLTPDEVAKMDNRYSIVFVRGYNPFFSEKYTLESHPNYIHAGLFSVENQFNYQSVKTKETPRMSPEEKAIRREELKTESADGVNLTVKAEIKSEKKIIETSLAGNLVLNPEIVTKRKTFDSEMTNLPESESLSKEEKGGANEKEEMLAGGIILDLGGLNKSPVKEPLSQMTTQELQETYY